MEAQLNNPISGELLEGFTRASADNAVAVSHVRGRFTRLTLAEVYPAGKRPVATSDENVIIIHYAYSLDEDLARLADEWRRTRDQFTSSPAKLAMHPAYQKIMTMGWAAVPFILRELQRQPDHWFWALTAITGVDPIPPEESGDFNAAVQAWIQWGRESGYI